MKKTLLVLSIIVCVAIAGAEASVAGKIRQGNRYFKKGQFDKAVAAYRAAQIQDPSNPYITYNIGNALYRQGQFDEAAAAFTKALAAKDPAQKGRAYFNLGNTAYRQGKTDEALDHYRKALAANHRDMDAKYNIEFLTMAKQQQKQQDNDKQKDDKNKDKDDKNKGTKDDKKNQAGGAGEEKKDDKSMSSEDAQRILQYYDEADKNAKKNTQKRPVARPKTDEDW